VIWVTIFAISFMTVLKVPFHPLIEWTSRLNFTW